MSTLRWIFKCVHVPSWSLCLLVLLVPKWMFVKLNQPLQLTKGQYFFLNLLRNLISVFHIKLLAWSPSVCQSVNLYLSGCPSLRRSICRSNYLFVILSLCRSVSLSVCQPVCLSVRLYASLSASVCLSVCMSVCRPLSVCQPVWLSVYLFVSLFFLPSSL